MNCDIVIEIGKDKKVIISKESSEQELDSLLDIVQHLKNTYSEKEF
jgi:hypothetical protein